MPALSFRSKRLYMRGIGKDVIEADLFHNLSRHGKICEIKMLSNYAFVQYESEEDASRVLEIYKSQPLMGKRVIIEFAHPLRKDIPSISSSDYSPKPYSPYSRYAKVRHPVVVFGLPRDMRWQELKDFGRSSGMLVAYCDLDRTEEGRGFIEYFTREDAKHAVNILNGSHIGGQKVCAVDYEDLRSRSTRGRSWDRHARSLKRRALDNYDRTLTRELSARQVYLPVHRLHDADSGNLDRRYSDGDTSGCSYSMASGTSYEEKFDWAYTKSTGSPKITAFQYQDHEYSHLQSCYVGAYHDSLIDYDPRHDIHQAQRTFDPYQ